MSTENIVYSTSLGGSMNLFEEAVKEKLHKERLEMEEFMFLEPLGNEEDHMTLYCGCEIGNCTCEEGM